MRDYVAFHRSVFGKLLAIMLTMAISLLTLVTWFFIHIMVTAFNESVEGIVDNYSHHLAASQLTFDEAKRLRHLDVEVRYEGPDGQWTTAEWLPHANEVKLTRGSWLLGGRGYYIARGPNGTYLFRWSYRRKTLNAHFALFSTLLALMIATIITTHLVIRRLLRPLRSLGDGVERLSAGELDVVLPAPTRDEFGVLTKAFNEMVARVRAMILARDQLLVDVSHELRSPLTRMRVALELLPEGADRARMTDDIVEMEAMIAELLELERLRDGRGIRPAPEDLAPIVRDIVARYENAKIVSLPSEIPIEIDAERFRIVLRNLLDNASKYSLPDSRAVEISAASDEKRVVLRISDDGPGIPDADRATIFEPFFRVNRARSKTPPGYGLGLSICKRIVEAHGGTISVAANKPRGTVFEIVLPR